MPKHILIPWSGGLDSTYLVWSNLTQGRHVKTLYIDVEANAPKVECEKKARENIIKEFENFGLLANFEDLRPTKVDFSFPELFDMRQNALWMMACAYACTEDTEKVQFGYVQGDDTTVYINDMYSLWNGLWNSLMGFTWNRLPGVEFPLLKHNKRYMFKELPETIRNHIWFCEVLDGDKKPCGVCEPCKRYKGLFPELFPTTNNYWDY